MVSEPDTDWPDYPFTSRYFTTKAGHRLHYIDEGPQAPTNAVPVVCVHGNPTWSFYFRSLINRLRSERRVLACDHLGMGLSDRPTAYGYTLAERVADLDAWLQAVIPEGPVDLVLHDWGGMIGGTWAVANAARVRRWAVHNTACFGLPPGKAIPWQLRLCRLPLVGALFVRGLNGFSRYAVKHCSAKKDGLAAEIATAYLRPYASWHDRRAVHRFVQDIPLRPEHTAWPIVQHTAEQAPMLLREAPLLVAWGERDFVFDNDFLTHWQELFPHAVVQRWRDAGHFLLEDEPAAAQTIAQFLTTEA